MNEVLEFSLLLFGDGLGYWDCIDFPFAVERPHWLKQNGRTVEREIEVVPAS